MPKHWAHRVLHPIVINKNTNAWSFVLLSTFLSFHHDSKPARMVGFETAITLNMLLRNGSNFLNLDTHWLFRSLLISPTRFSKQICFDSATSSLESHCGSRYIDTHLDCHGLWIQFNDVWFVNWIWTARQLTSSASDLVQYIESISTVRDGFFVSVVLCQIKMLANKRAMLREYCWAKKNVKSAKENHFVAKKVANAMLTRLLLNFTLAVFLDLLSLELRLQRCQIILQIWFPSNLHFSFDVTGLRKCIPHR